MIYAKKWGLFRHPAVRAELERLDPEKDAQRMVHLMLCYEFSFDMVRANELALFATYASTSISGLLDKTGEFRKHGQKRYDDTRFLITKFAEDGYDGPFGRRAIEQMNRIHGNYRIPNDDFLYVLSTFYFYPVRWMERYAWRPMTEKEKRAQFLFFMEVGKRMQLENLPDTVEEMEKFARTYEDKYFVYKESNRRVADATIDIFKGWFPRFLGPLFTPAVSALIEDKLRTAFGFSRPPGFFSAFLQGILWLRKMFFRILPLTFMPYPNLTSTTRFPSFSKREMEIEEIGPRGIVQRSVNQ